MALDRPYRNEGLDALYGRARDYWGNVAFLQLILDELAHRTTAAAKSIHAEVSERIADLRDDRKEAPAPRPDPLLDELTRLRAEKSAAEREIAELRQALVQAREAIRWQEGKLTAMAKGRHPVYRRVGLDEDCPDFVLKAVRTAYRKHLHPDVRPAPEKAEAERRFKEAEAVFDKLFALRRL